MIPKNFTGGLIAPDYKDSRDLLLADYLGDESIPDSIDLKSKDSAIEHQRFGSCTANAATGVKQFLDKKEYGKEIDLSQRFVYHNTKRISGLWDIEGDYLRNAIKALVKWGTPREELWAEGKGKLDEYLKTTPPPSVYKAAEQYKAKAYYRVATEVPSIKKTIAKLLSPLPTGMMWNESYKPKPDGYLPLPKGKKIGGHAIDIIDYSLDKIQFRNSWGKNWGLSGYFYIPVSEFGGHDFWDSWVVLDEILSKPLEGYVATEYLEPISYGAGSLVEPIANLNVRETPAGKKTGMVVAGDELEIVDGKVFTATFANNLYRWQKVRVKTASLPETTDTTQDSRDMNIKITFQSIG